MPAQIGHHVRHDLRFDAEDHDLAEISSLAVVSREINPVALYQFLAARCVRVRADENVIRADRAPRGVFL